MKTDPNQALEVLDSLTIKILFIISTLVTGAFFSALFASEHRSIFLLAEQNALLTWALPIVPLSVYVTAHISWEYLNTTLLKTYIKHVQNDSAIFKRVLHLLETKTRNITEEFKVISNSVELESEVASFLQKTRQKVKAANAKRDKGLKGLVDSVDEIESEFEKTTIHKYFAGIVIKFSLLVLASLGKYDRMLHILVVVVVILLLHEGMLRLTLRLLRRIVWHFVSVKYELIKTRVKMRVFFRTLKYAAKNAKIPSPIKQDVGKDGMPKSAL